MAAISTSLGGFTSMLPSVPTMLTVAAVGRELVLSKWVQNPLASTVSSKWTAKIAQFKPLASSLGTEEDKESESEVVVTDMIGDFATSLFRFLSTVKAAHWPFYGYSCRNFVQISTVQRGSITTVFITFRVMTPISLE
jgi:hypothetical protein